MFFLVGSTPAEDVFVPMIPWFLLSAFFWQLSTWAHRLTPYANRRQLIGREEVRTVSEAGLDVSGAVDATFLPWAHVVRLIETDDFFLFLGGLYRTHSIPKRLLDHEVQDTVRRLARNNLPAQRLSLSPGTGGRVERDPAP